MSRIIFIPKTIEVVVVSFGGVGTTFLMEHLARYKKVNCSDDTDGLKHVSIPPLSRNPELKLVYIFGDPRTAAISLFERKFHQAQYHKLQRLDYTSPRPPSREMTVETYARQDRDLLGFQQHFTNWYRGYPAHRPIMFLRYERLHHNLDKLAEFLQLPAEFVSSFPEMVSRKSSLDEWDRETRQGLDRMHQSFLAELEQVGDCVTRPVERRGAAWACLLDRSYRRALAEQFLHEPRKRAVHAVRLFAGRRH